MSPFNKLQSSTLALAITVFVLGSAELAQAQTKTLSGPSKVELDDVNIKGEVTRLNGLNLASRTKNNLDGRILLRKNFRERIVDELPPNFKSEDFDIERSTATAK